MPRVIGLVRPAGDFDVARADEIEVDASGFTSGNLETSDDNVQLALARINGLNIPEGEDFTSTLKTKLDGIATGAEVNVNADWDATSGDAQILNKPIVYSAAGAYPITATGFNGNLATTDDTVQKVAQKLDDLTLGSGGLTQNQVDTRITTLRPNAFTDADETKLDGIAAGAEVNVNADWDAASGDAQILNKPTIPSTAANIAVVASGFNGNLSTTDDDLQKVAQKVDDLTLGSGGLTQNQVDTRITTLRPNAFTDADETKLDGIAAGAEVNVQSDWDATSGDAQILNKPTIPPAQVQPDWNAASGLGSILNKPTLAPSNAEQNVQANWTESSTTSDAYIENKPTVYSAAGAYPVTATGFNGNLANTDDDLQKVAQKFDDYVPVGATESVVGITRFATQPEATAATLATVALTPRDLSGFVTGLTITDNTITVTRRGQANITLNLPSGGTPAAQTHAIWVAIADTQAQSTFAASDFAATGRFATEATGNTITIPTYPAGGATYRRFAIAIPTARELTSVTATGFLGDILDDMRKQGQLTLTGNEVVDVWVSNNALAVGGTVLTITTRDDTG